MTILPLEPSDLKLLAIPEYRWGSPLYDSQTPNWSHAIVIRRELIREPNGPIIPGRMQITRPAGRYEHMDIHTTCGQYVYFFMLVRDTRSAIDLHGGLDLRIMQYCDEVIKFERFTPDLGEVRYAKCRSEDPSALSADQCREKFIQDFMLRTAKR